MTNATDYGDRNRVIGAQVIARAWQDDSYKTQLLDNPKQILKEAGMQFPDSITVQVLESTAAVHYIVLPEGSTFADFKDEIATGTAPLFPLLSHQQIIIRQATEHVKYFILPAKPQLPLSEQQNTELERIALQEAVITTIDVAQTVEVATSVVGVAELGAIVIAVVVLI